MAIAPPGSAGLDIASIVNQLMALERRPLAALARQESALQAQISAWGRAKGSLAALQAAARELDRGERLRPMRAAAADATLVSASAGAGAVAGNHTLEVLALARQHKLASDGFASASSTVGSGTLTFQYGTWDGETFTPNGERPAQAVTIGAGQGTLAGIRDAVNAANIGVVASIIHDGAGERLVFASRDPGAANSLRVAVADDDGTNTDTEGLSRLAYDPAADPGSGRNLAETVAAQDAVLRIDGIEIRSARNTVSGAIPGVALTLLRAAPGSPTTLAVSRDLEALRASIQKFVDAYNSTAKVFRELTGYDPASRRAGELQGDGAALAVVSRLRATLTSALEHPAGSFDSLVRIGVSFQRDGTLALEESRLRAAADAAFDDIAAVFTRTLRAESPWVRLHAAGAGARAGTYEVHLTQAATRGSLAGSAAAGLEIVAGVNDQVEVAVDGVAATITLSAGTYASAAALGAELQSRLNGAQPLAAAGIRVVVSASAGVLTVTSERYGSASSVALLGGSGAENLFGPEPVANPGVDVAGTIGGFSASGNGRTLAAAAGTPAEGLQLEISATSAGALGTVTYSVGYAAQLSRLLDELLGRGGAVEARNEGLAARSSALRRRQAELNDRLGTIERRYREQFVALDAMLARMNATSTFLAQQLASLPLAHDARRTR